LLKAGIDISSALETAPAREGLAAHIDPLHMPKHPDLDRDGALSIVSTKHGIDQVGDVASEERAQTWFVVISRDAFTTNHV
jgi:hypothetical protein